MAHWKSLIQNFFANSDPGQSSVRLSPKGCAESAIKKSESEIGLNLPGELREFYAFSNGIGLGESVSDSPRFIPTIETLPKFIINARLSFSETHPDYADRYIPFIDWENGDSSGYLLNTDGTLLEYILIFSHEHYGNDDKQDINEFLTPIATSLEELLGRNR